MSEEEEQLPERRWTTVEVEPGDSPVFGGYEAWASCACGQRMTSKDVSNGDVLECGKCGRSYSVQFERVSGATRKHPVCPVCHVGMTALGGYQCPECDVDIDSAFVDTYDDVLREYQIVVWLDELGCDQSDSWHTHSQSTHEAFLRHCARCCPDCSCDCPASDSVSGSGLPRCRCDHDGVRVNIHRRGKIGRKDVYVMARRAVGVLGRFDCEAEERAVLHKERDDPLDAICDSDPFDPDG